MGLFSAQVVTGIALPAGMDKLYTGSKDETVRAWDTNTGQVWFFLSLAVLVSLLLLGKKRWEIYVCLQTWLFMRLYSISRTGISLKLFWDFFFFNFILSYVIKLLKKRYLEELLFKSIHVNNKILKDRLFMFLCCLIPKDHEEYLLFH